MQKIQHFILTILISGMLHAQSSTFEAVYNIMQLKCASCHVSGHESGLILSGTIGEVYDNLYNVTAHNPTAATANKKIVFPGDPYKSFLFTKVNHELALDVNLKPGEGAECPQDLVTLENKEIEMMRQWILYGAFETGLQVDELLIADFYENGGLQSVEAPPAPPDSTEGFQLHYGPYFLWPEQEHEYWSKFSTEIPSDIEIKKLDIVMGDYSHHYIIYKYDFATYALNPYGMRTDDPEFLGVSLVTANQYSDVLNLPEKTAFKWDSNTWLDLNSHYINYSSTLPLACEVYVNIYTQPIGTAIYEMHTDLPANTDIYIPNDNTPYVFEQTVNDNGNDDEIFIWAVTSHTHKYGDDYDIYKRTPAGEKGEKIFDASCGATNGVPGCVDEIYDYQHPPMRYFDSFLPIIPDDGIIHEATYINDGDFPVGFGLTSSDEMMVMIYFFIEDTLGLNLPSAITSDQTNEKLNIDVFPNPAQDIFYINVQDLISDQTQITIYDITGNAMKLANYSIISGTPKLLKIDASQFFAGIFLVQIEDKNGNKIIKKIVIE